MDGTARRARELREREGFKTYMPFRLSLFGPPRLLDGNGKLIPVPAKTFALVANLLLADGGAPVGRAALRGFLWESSDDKTAATNLRKFLMRIRERQATFEFELIRCGRSHVELAPSVEIDLRQFLDATSAKSSVDLAALCDIYRGDLLEGLEWEEAEFQDWLRVQRAQLREAFVSSVARRIDPIEPGADRMTLRIAARRLTEVDPYNEAAHRALMQLFAEDGERVRVRDLYCSLKQRLTKELGVEPDPATTDVYRRLLPTQGTGPGSSLPSVSAAPSTMQPNPAIAETPAPADVMRRAGTPRITILPPQPLGGQDFRHQIAGSLVEDVTIGLCRFKSLSVVAPHTAWELSLNGKRALFKNFGIDYAVETLLQNRGGALWLSVKLLEAAGRRVLWTDHYSLSEAQEARHYHQLSVQILTSLVANVELAELAYYDVEHDPTAYHFYLGGQRYLRRLDLPNVRRARRAFRSALSTCPEFMPALSGLARTLRLEWVLLARGDPDLLVEAEKLARRSLELDPDDARGYRELGACTLYAGRFDESLKAFREAETRNPQFADLLMDFGDALTHACEPAAGLQKITHAIELNPLCPDQYWWAASGANFHLREYVDAIACIQCMQDQTPAYRLLAASYAMLGEREQAADYVHRTKEFHPDFNVSGWLSILPIRDQSYARHYEQGLREAGFD